MPILLKRTVGVNISKNIRIKHLEWSGVLADLTAYYKLNAAAGVVVDSSGNGLNGTNNGATRNVAGKINKCFSFDGINDYVNISDDVKLNFGSYLSVCLWINPVAKATFGELVSQMGVGGNYGWFISLHGNNKIRFWISADGGGVNREYGDSTNIAPDGSWTFIVGVWDNGDLKIYINGTEEVLSASGGAENSIFNSTADLGMGARAGDLSIYHKGLIDEVLIYGRALSDSEITQLYNDGLAGREQN